jgi:hypothetical protein
MAWASTTMNSYVSNILCIARPIWRRRIPTKLQALYAEGLVHKPPTASNGVMAQRQRM